MDNSKNWLILAITLICIVFVLISETNCFSEPFASNQIENDDDVPGEPLNPQDFRNAEKLTSHALSQVLYETLPDADPIETAGLHEGDIVLIPNADEQSNAKNAVRDRRYLWKNGTIPYLISSKFNDHERSVIARAVLEFHRQSCLQFRPRQTEKDYIMITSGKGCSSPVGRVGGGQIVTLGNGCIYAGIIMHELLHAVGFWHEQSRWDRDSYVNVFYENIQPGMEDNFNKISWRETQNLSAAYDTFSLMHYGQFAFSKQKGYKTIIPKVPNQNMGQRVNFSETDVFKLKKLYNCDKNIESDSDTENGASESTDNSQQCTDNHPNCKYWANNGECRKNPNWMLVNCKLSCDNCRNPCSNNNKHCDSWATSGECDKNKEYMHIYCKKACNKC